MQRRKRKVQWLTYAQAARIAKENGCTSRQSFWNWHNRARPNNIPKMPNRVYKEWSTWGEFLGTNNIFAKYEKGTFRPYWEAVRWVQPVCINNEVDSAIKWYHYYDEHESEIPSDIPKYPNYHYAESWTGWGTWLGKNIESKIVAHQQNIGVFALCNLSYAAKNVIRVVVANDGTTQLKDKMVELSAYPVAVYQFDQQRAVVYTKILNHYATQGDDGNYIVTNMDALLFEFDRIEERVKL